MKIYPAGISDESLWMRSVTMRFEVLMTDPIDISALEKAVMRTQMCYVLLQIKPIIHNERVCYVHNERPFILRENARCGFLEFGKNTNDYPWSICYSGNNLTAVFHHGLFDGNGVLEIMRTLLLEYTLACGIAVADKGSIYTAEDSIPAEQQLELPNETYSKLEQGKILPVKRSARKIDPIPAHYYSGETPVLRRLVFDSESFMSRVREMNTSPIALMSMIVFEGLRPLTDVESPNMLGVIATNLRPIFESKTMCNFVGCQFMDYDTQVMDHMDDDMKCTVLRTKLDLMLDKNACIALTKQNMENYQKTAALPYAERKRAVLKAFEQILSNEPKPTTSVAFLSYLGRINLPNAVGDQVQDVLFTLPPLVPSTMVEWFDLNGKMIFHVYAGLNTLSPLLNIRDSLIKMGVPCQLEEPLSLPVSRYVHDSI